jgi:hypothetical protein
VLLLDTHVWVWSVEGDVRRVGRRANIFAGERRIYSVVALDSLVERIEEPPMEFRINHAALHQMLTKGRMNCGMLSKS